VSKLIQNEVRPLMMLQAHHSLDAMFLAGGHVSEQTHQQKMEIKVMEIVSVQMTVVSCEGMNQQTSLDMPPVICSSPMLNHPRFLWLHHGKKPKRPLTCFPHASLMCSTVATRHPLRTASGVANVNASLVCQKKTARKEFPLCHFTKEVKKLNLQKMATNKAPRWLCFALDGGFIGNPVWCGHSLARVQHSCKW